MRKLKRVVVALLAVLMLVSFSSVPVLAASETHAASVQVAETFADYDTADVAAINAMIQSNASLSVAYKINEPQNWDFVGWNEEGTPYRARSIVMSGPFDGQSYKKTNKYSGELLIANLPELEWIYLTATRLTALTLDNVPKLEMLDGNDSDLEKVSLTGAQNLKTVKLSLTKVKSLDLSGLHNLELFESIGAPLHTLDLTGCTKLKRDKFRDTDYFARAYKKLTTVNGKTIIVTQPKGSTICLIYNPDKNEIALSRWKRMPISYTAALKNGEAVEWTEAFNWKLSPTAKLTKLNRLYQKFTPRAQTTTVSVGAGKDTASTSKTTKVNFPQASVRMTLNKSLTIPAVAYTSDNKTAKVTYSSSKPEVATVSASGKIVAKAPGTTVITAKSGSKKDTLKVTVVAAGTKATKVKKVTGNVPAQMSVGATKYITPKVSPAKATNVKVTYSSSNKGVVTVDKTGKLTAKKAGVAVITIKAGGKSAKYTVTVM